MMVSIPGDRGRKREREKKIGQRGQVDLCNCFIEVLGGRERSGANHDLGGPSAPSLTQHLFLFAGRSASAPKNCGRRCSVLKDSLVIEDHFLQPAFSKLLNDTLVQ